MQLLGLQPHFLVTEVTGFSGARGGIVAVAR
jgi:hypothetical protein